MKILRHAEAWNQGAIGLRAEDFRDGLLFIMPAMAPWPITMKGVEVPLDVYWLNQAGMVVEWASLAPGMGDYWPEYSGAYILELPMLGAPRYDVGDFVEVRSDEATAT